MATVEFRFTEVEVDGRTLEGVAMPYGNVATLPGGVRERFEAGVVRGRRAGGRDIKCSAQIEDRPIARSNGGGLVVSDSTEKLTIKATLAGDQRGRRHPPAGQGENPPGPIRWLHCLERTDRGRRPGHRAGSAPEVSQLSIQRSLSCGFDHGPRGRRHRRRCRKRSRVGARWQREFML